MTYLLDLGWEYIDDLPIRSNQSSICLSSPMDTLPHPRWLTTKESNLPATISLMWKEIDKHLSIYDPTVDVTHLATSGGCLASNNRFSVFRSKAIVNNDANIPNIMAGKYKQHVIINNQHNASIDIQYWYRNIIIQTNLNMAAVRICFLYILWYFCVQDRYTYFISC
jgi:hypothetical protein